MCGFLGAGMAVCPTQVDFLFVLNRGLHMKKYFKIISAFVDVRLK